jgi:hypothetical protein
MKVIKTENHIIMTSEITDPKYICISECKKVWWDSDIHIDASILETPICPMCGGPLRAASKEDYECLN